MKRLLWAPFLASTLIAPCHAGEFDNLGPSTQLYIRIPIGYATPKERAPSFGFTIRGSQEYQVFTLDSRTLDAISRASYDGGLIGGLIEAKWLIIGGVAAAGAVAVAKKGGGGPSSGPTKQGTPPPPQQDPQTQQNTPCTC
jgi:hypothetical protein